VLAVLAKELAQVKREQLKKAILLQKAEIAAEEEKEAEMGEKAGEIYGADIPEVEIDDGYIAEEAEAQADPECDDSTSDEMTVESKPLPPKLIPRYPTAPVAPEPTDNVGINPEVDWLTPGEMPPTLDQLHPDTPSDMPISQFQDWGLSHTADESVGTTTTTYQARSTAPVDAVGVAQGKAKEILSGYFTTNPGTVLENKEGGMEGHVAWGVMNSAKVDPEPPIAAPEEEYVPSPSSSPYPSASPSPLPREIYLKQSSLLQKEVGDLSFANLLHVAAPSMMHEEQQEPETPFEVLQPTDSAVQYSYVGAMPHPATLDPSDLKSDLTGMGRETNGALVPEVLVQTSAGMNRAPKRTML